jgi:hypothetical protein
MCTKGSGNTKVERHLQLDYWSGEVDAHQLVRFVVTVAAEHEMHDALARQPGERHHREHHELTQLAKGGGQDQEGKATDRQGYGHALQHATRHSPPPHRHHC